MTRDSSTQPKQKRTYTRRSSHPNFCRGENHPQAKLTWEQVERIRELYFDPTLSRNDQYSQSALARMFGVSQSLITVIVRSRVWKKPSS